VNVEEGDAVALAQLASVNVEHVAADFLKPPDRDVAGDERVGDAREPPALEVYVRAADLAQLDGEQRGVLFKLRLRDFAQLD
jgi:hypothetical protein